MTLAALILLFVSSWLTTCLACCGACAGGRSGGRRQGRNLKEYDAEKNQYNASTMPNTMYAESMRAEAIRDEERRKAEAAVALQTSVFTRADLITMLNLEKCRQRGSWFAFF